MADRTKARAIIGLAAALVVVGAWCAAPAGGSPPRGAPVPSDPAGPPWELESPASQPLSAAPLPPEAGHGNWDHLPASGAGEAAPRYHVPAGGATAAVVCPPRTRRRSLAEWWRYQAKPSLQESHWGYADLFEPRPFGTYMRAHMNTQIGAGDAAQLVLYRYDFHDGAEADADRLNWFGRDKLNQFVVRSQLTLQPLLIEQTRGRPDLDAARKAHVRRLLVEADIEVPAEWIVVGRPAERPRSGAEAVLEHRNMLRGAARGSGPGVGAGTPGAAGAGMGAGTPGGGGFGAGTSGDATER